MAKKPKRRDSITSSGGHKRAKINLQIRRTAMKINRWKRYQQEIEDGKRSGNKLRWDTSGLEKHLDLLQSLI